MSDFNEYYSAYPKKKQRKDAAKAWGEVKDNLPPQDELMRILERHIKSWVNLDDKFIPYPSSWLRAQMWEDEINDIQTIEDRQESMIKRMMKRVGDLP